VRNVCRENNPDAQPAELALHRIDLVIADSPIPHGVNVRGFNHQLGECGISFLAAPQLAKTTLLSQPLQKQHVSGCLKMLRNKPIKR